MSSQRVVRLLAPMFFVAATALLGLATPAGARPSSDCLPDETFVVVRLPGLQAFFEAIGDRTKLGAVVRDEKRLAAVKRWALAESDGEFDSFMAQLGELGFDDGDLSPLLRGELGYAGTLSPRPGKRPLYIGLAWSDCGPEIAGKLSAAADRLVERRGEGKFPIRREDIDLAGAKVRHLMLPIVGPPHGTLRLGVKLTEAEGLKVNTEIDRADGDDIEQGVIHLLFCEHDGKFLVAHTIGPFQTGADNKPEADDPATSEQARAVLGRFLAAHSSNDEGVYFRWMHAPGMQAALPEGLPLIEFAIDVRPLVNLFLPAEEPFGKFVRAAKLDSLGVIAGRSTLDGTVLRGGTFASAPAPRAGLLSLLDQKPIAPQPPDWVSADVLGYQHASFDLGKAYSLVADTLRKSAINEGRSLDEFEGQIEAFLQVGPAELLSSLGSTHTLVSLVPETGGPDAANLEDPNAMAIVWEIADQALWQRLMALAAPAVAQKIEVIGEFRGLRHEEGTVHGGWFIGNNKMFVAIGKGATDKAAAMLRSASATNSLRSSDQARRGAELLPGRDGIVFELANGPSMLKLVNRAVVEALDAEQSAEAKEVRRLWPTDEELSGVVGVSVSATTVDENGLTNRSAADLPPP